jgi:hypothetical protein
MSGRLTHSLTWPLLAVLGIGIGLSAAYARHRGVPHADKTAAVGLVAGAAVTLILTWSARRLQSWRARRQPRRPVLVQRADPGLADQVAAISGRLDNVARIVAKAYSAEGLPVPDALMPASDTVPIPKLHLASVDGRRA